MPSSCLAGASAMARFTFGRLVRNLGLYKLRKLCQRILPAEITHLGRDDLGESFLDDVELRSAGYLLQGDRRLHLSGQVGVVEAIGVANSLERHKLLILATERVPVSRRKVRKRHSVGAAHLDVHMVDLAGESVGGEPLGHGVSVEKRPIDAFRCGTENSVKSDGARGHDGLSLDR